MPSGKKATEKLKKVEVGGRDPLVSFRMPQESIDKLNFIVSTGQAKSLSEAARTFVHAQLTLAGIGKDQVGSLLARYYRFLDWIADPLELIMYLNFRSSLLSLPAAVKAQYALALADKFFKVIQLLNSEQQQQMGVDGLDKPALSAAIMKSIGGSPRVEPDSLKADAEPEKPPITDPMGVALKTFTEAVQEKYARGGFPEVASLANDIKLMLEMARAYTDLGLPQPIGPLLDTISVPGTTPVPGTTKIDPKLVRAEFFTWSRKALPEIDSEFMERVYDLLMSMMGIPSADVDDGDPQIMQM